MAPNLFRFLLLLVAAYAFLRGSRDERQVGIVLVIGVVATTLVLLNLVVDLLYGVLDPRIRHG